MRPTRSLIILALEQRLAWFSGDRICFPPERVSTHLMICGVRINTFGFYFIRAGLGWAPWQIVPSRVDADFYVSESLLAAMLLMFYHTPPKGDPKTFLKGVSISGLFRRDF